MSVRTLSILSCEDFCFPCDRDGELFGQNSNQRRTLTTGAASLDNLNVLNNFMPNFSEFKLQILFF